MSTTLGKRKERDEADSAHHHSTLFISNLPYSATSTDLQTLFSDIAPVRSAFVVTEHGTGVSKGVGYVSFALQEDAQTTHDKLCEEGLPLNGRKLRVTWADNKPNMKERHVRPITTPKPQPASHAKRLPVAHDPDAVRIIVISGLPASIDKNTLWKKVRKNTGAESVQWPVESASNQVDNIAEVLFDTSNHAQDAVQKLHAHVFKGALLSVTLKRRLQTLQKAPVTTTSHGASSAPTAAPSRSSRLIVRNLPWGTTGQDLRAVFLPHGPIYKIDFPKSGEKGQSRGFAFVWMLSRKDAEHALEACNGTKLRAGMAKGLVEDKQKKKKVKRLEKKAKMTEGAEEPADDEVEADEDMEEEKPGRERPIIVDWALSKEKWEEERTKMDQGVAGIVEQENVDVEMGSYDDEDSDEEPTLGLHDAQEGGSDPDGEDVDERDDGDEEPVKPQLPPPETGTTLFIRNIPFTATEDELRTLFRGFGPLRYARITMDRELGRSRGTGFACFWNIADADKVIEQSELLRAQMTGIPSEIPKKNPFTLPSILTPDPSSGLAQSLVLHGRALDVVRAVTRDEAGKLKDEGERRREKADKRNMYLLREGVILPNTPASETLSAMEVEKRTSAFNARRALLRSNPALFISKTRLSVRQIPIFVTEKMLKRLAIHAVRAFEDDVRNGQRNGLTADELSSIHEEPAGSDDDEKTGVKAEDDKKKKPWKKFGRKTGVKQSKIVRQQERVDAVTGKGRSKGYGFVEMEQHADALRVLRWANNNTAVTTLWGKWWKEELKGLVETEGKKTREDRDNARLKRMTDELQRLEEETGDKAKGKGSLIVEFSIENVQVVQRRKTQMNDKSTANDKAPTKPAPLKIKREDISERPSKKRRPSNTATEDSSSKSSTIVALKEKEKDRLGPLIGRKRKERRQGKKAKA